MTNNMTIAVDLGKDITDELMIEQLGGYNAAKAKFRDNGSFHAERMKAALLAYRRAHNIYEVGDYILPNSKFLSFEPYLLTEDCKFEYKYNTKSGHWGIVLKSYLPKAWRHATNDEIKANHRLDVYKKGDSVIYEVMRMKGEFIQYVESPSGHCLVDFGLCDAGLIPLEHLQHATASDRRLDQ